MYMLPVSAIRKAPPAGHPALPILTFGLCILTFACIDSSKTPPPSSNVLATLTVSGARFGQLAPCECRSQQFGGVDREARILAARRQEGVRQIRLDAGGFTSPLYNAHEDIKGRFVLKALGALEISHANVSWSDLMLGREALERIAGEHQITLLSANIVDAQTQRPVFEPYATVALNDGKKAAGRLLFIGVTEDFPKGVKNNDHYTSRALQRYAVLDPAAALARVVREQRRPGDIVIALAFVNWQGAPELFRGVEGVNLALNGFHFLAETQEAQAGSTRLIAAGFQGRFFQEISLARGGQNDRQAVRIGGVKEVQVPAEHDREPRLTKLIDEYNSEIARVFGSKQPLISPYAPLSKEQKEPADRNRYVGYQPCRQCHAATVESWEQTHHARAMDTLTAKRRQYDPDCVKCHATGFQQWGFYNLDSTPHLTGVQCEVCHGKGYLHVKEEQRIAMLALKAPQPRQHQLPAPANAEFCIRCHDLENDADFDFARDQAAIAHPEKEPEKTQLKDGATTGAK